MAEALSLLTMGGEGVSVGDADFAFFLLDVDDLQNPERRIPLSPEDLRLLNPNTRNCPIFRTRRDVEITKSIYRRLPVLINENERDGNPWGITFMAMFHMSSDSSLFRTRDELKADGWTLEGNVFHRNGKRYLPLYEAKMVDHYDHRCSQVVISPTATVRQGQPEDLSLEQHQDPYCLRVPRYWVANNIVEQVLPEGFRSSWFAGFSNVTSPTNARTMIATLLPKSAVGHSMPVILFPQEMPAILGAAFNAMFTSFVFDYVGRQKLGGVNYTFFIIKQLPVLMPGTLLQQCPWDASMVVAAWVASRVLELTYTAWDLQHFARELDYYGPPFAWDPERRFMLRCELDAAFFHLYGIERDDVDYIMETFPIVKRKDEATHGEYRTKRLILDKYDELAAKLSELKESARL